MSLLAKNKKAYFDYDVLEKFEAGLVLIGQEVKSIKKGSITLKGSYIIPRNNELFLVGCHVPAYQPKNIADYQPDRSRKLLLKKKEIEYLIEKSQEKSLTLIPLKVYTMKGFIKIEIAVGRGKKKFDKRDSLKKKDIDKKLKKSLKSE
jgi:SsrA-binding protein